MPDWLAAHQARPRGPPATLDLAWPPTKLGRDSASPTAPPPRQPARFRGKSRDTGMLVWAGRSSIMERTAQAFVEPSQPTAHRPDHHDVTSGLAEKNFQTTDRLPTAVHMLPLAA